MSTKKISKKKNDWFIAVLCDPRFPGVYKYPGLQETFSAKPFCIVRGRGKQLFEDLNNRVPDAIERAEAAGCHFTMLPGYD